MASENTADLSQAPIAMEAIDGCAERAVSSRVVWGVGETARELASRISQDVEARLGRPGSIHLFVPDEDPYPAFRELVAKLAEAARIRGEDLELEIKVILAGWEAQDTDIAELFGAISKILEDVLAVRRTLTLTVLIPPPTAADDVRDRVFWDFLELEKLLGELPFLNSAFVYQMPIELYEQPLEDAATTDDLVELLAREFADSDLLTSIHQQVYPVLRQKQKTAGRAAVYSALGAQRLIYLQEELLRHLETRFQQDLLRQGMLDRQAVSTVVLERTAKLADDCLIDCRQAILPYMGSRSKSESRLPLLSTVGNPAHMTGPVFENKLDVAIGVINAELEPLFKELDQKLRQAFDDVLALQGQNSACARHYLEQILGEPERAGPDGRELEADGLFAVQLEAVSPAFLKSASAFIRRTSQEFAAESGISLSRGGADVDPIKALDAYVEALQAAFADSDFRSRYLIQTISSTWDTLKNHAHQVWFGHDEAWGLFLEVFADFSGTFQKLKQLLNENERNLQELEKKRLALREVYPWYKRIFNMPAAYRSEKHRLKVLAGEFAKEREMFHHTSATLEAFLRSLIEEVLWPHLLPALVMHGLRATVHKLMDELDGFIGRVTTHCSEQWQAAEHITEQDRLTQTTILTRRKLDILYKQQLGSRFWGEFANEMILFVPPRLGLGTKEQPAYANCLNLRDHFHAGGDSLIARMSDYTVAFFFPMQALNALDIIEVGGDAQTRKFLTRILSKTEYLPEFSTGMIPLAQEKNALKRVRVIRCTAEIREKLKAEYSDLLDDNDRFVDIDDSQVIDLSVIRYGFPAFLLHVLRMARQVILNREGEMQVDIWPE